MVDLPLPMEELATCLFVFLVNNHEFISLNILTQKISKTICAKEECKEKHA